MVQACQVVFEQYIALCNQVLAEHKDAFPYKQIWAALETQQAGRVIDLTVCDNEPQAHYMLCLENNHIDIVASDNNVPKGNEMHIEYMRQVVEHPEDYVHHPAKLDWSWLRA